MIVLMKELNLFVCVTSYLSIYTGQCNMAQAPNRGNGELDVEYLLTSSFFISYVLFDGMLP